MIIRLPTQDYSKCREFSYRLMSDLHIGSAHCDKDRIKSELEDARRNNSRVFINGDVFDMIFPKDSKRYVPSMYDEELRGKDAILNASLDLGVKLLRPYADLIDVIGVGNHETSSTKWNGNDIIALLVERLSTPKHKIHHGAYSGAIEAKFSRGNGGGCRYIIFYHHGAGGSSPVTKGMIDFSRMSTWVRDADVIWCGHKHTRWAAQVMEQRVPYKGDKLERKPVWHIQTGSYTKNEGKKQLDDIGSYVSDFGIERNFAPESTGGARIDVRIVMGSAARPESQVVMA